MAYAGILTEVGPDAIGYVGCEELGYMYSLRIRDIVNISEASAESQKHPEILNGRLVSFDLAGNRAINIRLKALAAMAARAGS